MHRGKWRHCKLDFREVSFGNRKFGITPFTFYKMTTTDFHISDGGNGNHYCACFYEPK